MAITSEQAADAFLVRNVTTIGHVDHGTPGLGHLEFRGGVVNPAEVRQTRR